MRTWCGDKEGKKEPGRVPHVGRPGSGHGPAQPSVGSAGKAEEGFQQAYLTFVAGVKLPCPEAHDPRRKGRLGDRDRRVAQPGPGPRARLPVPMPAKSAARLHPRRGLGAGSSQRKVADISGTPRLGHLGVAVRDSTSLPAWGEAEQALKETLRRASSAGVPAPPWKDAEHEPMEGSRSARVSTLNGHPTR